MKKKLLVGLATGLFLVGLASGASATAISLNYGGFEGTDTSSTASGYNAVGDIAGWTITGQAATLDTQGYADARSPLLPVIAVSTDSKVATLGNSDFGGAISQSLSETYQANTLYTLSFDLGWRNWMSGPAAVEVSLLGNSGVIVTSGERTSTAQGDWQRYSLTYTTLGSSVLGETIGISFVRSGGIQALIDNVSLDSSFLRTGDDQAPTPTPEPATMLLFGSGLVGLAGYGRRKKAKK